MAVKASANITLFHIIDIDSVVIYYLLQSSTANPPAKPTTNPPGGSWTTTEPTYTEGSTDTLYTVTETIYSDGSFEYTPVSKSTAFEAAKAAYNKATNALNGQAVISSSTAPSDHSKIWYNTTDNHFYHYTQTSEDPPTYDWMGIEDDYSDEFKGIRDDIKEAKEYADGLEQGIRNDLNDNYFTASKVRSEIESTETGLRENFYSDLDVVRRMAQLEYELLTSQPSDWSTNWKDYYTFDSDKNKYNQIQDDTAPTWAANTYYKAGKTAITLIDEINSCIERGMDPTTGKPYVFLKTGSDDGYKLKIQNDSIIIYKGSTAVSTWLSDKFDVSMVITSTLSLGKFDFIVNSDNSLSFKKVR